jgi:hypothetical protein
LAQIFTKGASSEEEDAPLPNQSPPPSLPAQKPPRFQLGLFLFLVGLAVAFYLLGQSMVSHRFFRGGRMDRYGHVRQ